MEALCVLWIVRRLFCFALCDDFFGFVVDDVVVQLGL
jgi:hypothetical protein